ncbi:MAG TPA: hypothetical protein VJT49_27300 [Amycolatopsis sp.]|uniref:hypothetical protein n=1 Tax=Amycolatopsis sp. TaxID=37632 RepID=UPI002B4A92B0|nr:hypothetical protein [Amycolatopsis sp.]HKS48749.1 hypothetical protein [Amycolatopsis sp.]
MPKPTPLQVRNIIMAVLMAAAAGWNTWRGGPVWLTAIFGVGCVLAAGSAALNGREPN